MRSCGEQSTLRSGLIGVDETFEENSGSCGDGESNGSVIVLGSGLERM
jgi:hypothetical protein